MFGVVLAKYGSAKESLVLKDDVGIPSIAENEVLVKVAFSGFNHLDTKIRRGYMPQMKIKILGIEYSGYVEKVGKEVEGVFGFSMPKMSTYAEYVPVASDKVSKLSDAVSDKVGSALPCTIHTVWQLFKRLFGDKVNSTEFYEKKENLEQLKGRSVLVVGCSGPLGNMCLILSKFVFGAEKVIGVCSEKHHKEMEKLGCDVLFDYHTKDYHKKCLDNNIFCVLDCFGGFENLEMFAPLIKENQLYLTPGVPDGVDPGEFIKKISGKKNCEFVGHQKIISELSFVTDLLVKMNLLEKIKIVEYPLREAVKCHETYHNERPCGKIVLKVK